MAEKFPESVYFSHDREQLMNTIARFDDGLKVEDIVCPENESDNLKQYSNTVFIQVLLEFICHAFVKDENHREKLLIEACKRLSKFKILNDLLIMDKSNQLRLTMKYKIINFLKQICEEVIPAAELNTNAVHIFQNDSVSTDLKLYYCSNFIELGKIAEGGFGSVYKAQYKLNKLTYAIKKIPFDYKTDANFLMVMREANNFAALNHLNIVRYYSAWIELSESDVVSKQSTDDMSFAPDVRDSDVTGEYSGLVIKVTPPNGSLDHLRTKNSRKNSFRSSDSESDSVIFSETADVTKGLNWFVNSNSQISADHSQEDMRNEYENLDNNEDFPSSNFKIQGVLYIQMEYCDCDLRFWLDKRAETKGRELPFQMDVNEIFTNIVKGVAHIHSRGIIHRDLKPHNIFYSQSCNTVKIGDFGLATLSGFSIDSFNNISQDHSSCIGTLPYAAPEQRKSKKYDMKVDIYSLGVILIELINICTTRSELSHIIEIIKDGKVKGEHGKFPILERLASILVSDDPKKRMSAKEILDFIDKDAKVILKEVIKNEFVTEIKEKDQTILSLNKLIRDSDYRYEHLENNYKNLNNKYEDLQSNYEKLNDRYQQINTTLVKMQEVVEHQNLEISKLNQVLLELNMKSLHS